MQERSSKRGCSTSLTLVVPASQVLLAHLQGANDSNNTASTAPRASAVHTDSSTPQRAKTSHYRSILAVVRHLLRKQGLSLQAAKTVALAVRLAFLARAAEELDSLDASGAALDESDVCLLHVACQQTAVAAVKHSDRGALPAPALAAIHAYLAAFTERIKVGGSVTSVLHILQLLFLSRSPSVVWCGVVWHACVVVQATKAVGTSYEPLPLLRLETPAAEFVPLSGFNLHRDTRSTDKFAGAGEEPRANLFVDMLDGLQAAPETFEQVAKVLRRCEVICDALLDRVSEVGGGCQLAIGLHTKRPMRL